MVDNIKECALLNNGVKMPWLGLGVYKVQNGEEVIHSIKSAVNAGYRSIDTAAFYENEEGVGQAIKECGVPREELFITTKVWNDQHGYEPALKAFEESRKKLKTDYVDLFLIHWPVTGMYKDTWRALEKLYKDGYIRAIGVSNFHIHHLKDLMGDCEITPAVNQVEFHPYLTQRNLHSFCREQGIQLEAWGPLARGAVVKDKIIQEIASKYKKTPAQIVLRWDVQKQVVTIPKSVQEYRIIENMEIFYFELTEDEMKKIDSLNRDERTGPNPDTFV